MGVFFKRHVIADMSCCCDLSLRDIDVLRHIIRYDAGITPALLSNITRFDPATILRANLKLVAGGYIQIVEHHIDSRAHLVHITPKGRTALSHLTDIYMRQQNRLIPYILPRLSEEEANIFFSTCLDIQDHAESLASISPKGKIRSNSVTYLSRQLLERSFDRLKTHPEFILYLYCHRIHTDYLSFLKTHAIPKLSTDQKMNIRELRVLMTLHYLEKDATAMDVANILRFDPATVSRAVVALKKYGFIATSQFEDPDERKKPLTLAPEGLKIGDEYLEIVRQSFTEAREMLRLKLDPKTLQRYLSVLLTLRERTHQFAQAKKRYDNIKHLERFRVA